ncbi:MAG: hypothetical protein NWR03_03685 [Akkermansiaceae bacterium]|nr:hypothetical protein [Akkermansiaceae bacterium]
MKRTQEGVWIATPPQCPGKEGINVGTLIGVISSLNLINAILLKIDEEYDCNYRVSKNGGVQ